MIEMKIILSIPKTIITKEIIPGARPNVMTSANESNCFPIAPETPILRATNPSKKSKTAPRNINNGAMSILPAKAKIIAMKPHSMLEPVIRFAKLNIDTNIRTSSAFGQVQGKQINKFLNTIHDFFVITPYYNTKNSKNTPYYYTKNSKNTPYYVTIIFIFVLLNSSK
jgi:hypothetical protein